MRGDKSALYSIAFSWSLDLFIKRPVDKFFESTFKCHDFSRISEVKREQLPASGI